MESSIAESPKPPTFNADLLWQKTFGNRDNDDAVDHPHSKKSSSVTNHSDSSGISYQELKVSPSTTNSNLEVYTERSDFSQVVEVNQKRVNCVKVVTLDKHEKP